MRKDSYHAHIYNKQTNTTITCIRNTYIVTYIRTPSQNILRIYLCNVWMGSLLPRILRNLPLVILFRVLVINFHCPFYIRDTISSTDIDHMILNMESVVIEPHTDKGWSTGQSRTKCDLAFYVESTSQYLIVETQLWNLGGTCENPLYTKSRHCSYSLVETLFMPIQALLISTS